MAVLDEYLIFGGFNRASPTYTWTVFMYDQAFKLGLWRQGYAAAIALIGAVAMMLVMAVLLRIFRPKG
jgi:multiple sugar transport system permease protein